MAFGGAARQSCAKDLRAISRVRDTGALRREPRGGAVTRPRFRHRDAQLLMKAAEAAVCTDQEAAGCLRRLLLRSRYRIGRFPRPTLPRCPPGNGGIGTP